MTMKLVINGREISHNSPPYIIAEMSANHNGSLDNAFKIIDVAVAAGADAVKLQTYSADTITINNSSPQFQIDSGLWKGKNLYQLYSEAQMPWDWHKPLFDYARKKSITIFSSPFDYTAVDLLEDLNTPAYKIASFELIDLPLIRYVAQTKKPMIMSTGMASIDEIAEAVDVARSNGCTELALLHCVSGYPAPSGDYNLKTIDAMRRKFGLVTGLSDHTIDNVTAVASVAIGAAIIEKHVTLDRNGGGADDSFSLEPKDLEALCRDARIAWSALGVETFERKASELANVKFRRSLYFVKELKAGQKITEKDVRSIRPGYGLAPKHFDSILGKTLIKDVQFGTPTSWDLFE